MHSAQGKLEIGTRLNGANHVQLRARARRPYPYPVRARVQEKYVSICVALHANVVVVARLIDDEAGRAHGKPNAAIVNHPIACPAAGRPQQTRITNVRAIIKRMRGILAGQRRRNF